MHNRKYCAEIAHNVATRNRAAIVDYLENTESWDFEAETGKAVTDVVASWWGVAGMYGGAGAAADAYRYGVLRDQRYPLAEVDREPSNAPPIRT